MIHRAARGLLSLIFVWIAVCPLALHATPPDPNANVEIYVLDGTDPLTANWRPVNGSDPGEAAAEATMRKVMRESPPLRRMMASAFERMAAFQSSPSGSRWQMNENKKLVIVLEMTEQATNGTDHANFKTQTSGELTAFVKKSGAGLVGLSPEALAKAELNIADVLLHEFDHIKLLFAEADFVNRFNGKTADRAWWNAGGKEFHPDPNQTGHDPFTVYVEPQKALLEGKAMGAELFYFKTQAFIYPFYEQGFFEGGLWTAYRAKLPIGKRILVRLAELSKALPGMTRLRAGEWIKARYGLDMPDPALQMGNGGKGIPTLRTYDQMMRNEGVVSLIINDLFESGITNEGLIDKLIAEKGASDLNTLVEHLQGEITTPQVKAQLDAIVARRTLGAKVNYAEASRLWEMRLSGKLTAKDYAKRLDRLIETAVGETYKTTIVMDDLPKQELLATTVKARPSARVRALLNAIGSNEVIQGQTKFFLAYFIAHYANALLFGGEKNPIENMKQASKALGTKEFWISMGTYMGVMDGMPKILEWGGKSLAARGANALAPRLMLNSAKVISRWGGLVGMLVAGVLLRQILANDYSFWRCTDTSFWDKLGMTVKVFFTDWSTWDSKAIGSLVGGAIGFAVVMVVASSCIAGPVGFLGSVAILAVAFVVSYVGAWLGEKIGGLLQAWSYSNLKDSIKWVLSEAGKPDATASPGFWSFTWLHMDSEDQDALKTVGSVDQKRTVLAHALGTVGDKDPSKYRCKNEPPETVKAVLKGQFKEFFGQRDKDLEEELTKMNGAVADERKAMESAENEMKEADPLAHGVDTRKMTLLMCLDTDGNFLTAAEIATGLVVGVVSDEKLRKQYGISGVDDEAGIDALHQRLEGEIQGVLDSMTVQERIRQHEEVLSKVEDDLKRAGDRVEEATKEWVAKVRERTKEHLQVLKGIVNQELADEAEFDFTPVKDRAGPLIEFLERRKDGLTRLIKAYDDIMSGNDQAAAAGQ